MFIPLAPRLLKDPQMKQSFLSCSGASQNHSIQMKRILLALTFVGTLAGCLAGFAQTSSPDATAPAASVTPAKDAAPPAAAAEAAPAAQVPAPAAAAITPPTPAVTAPAAAEVAANNARPPAPRCRRAPRQHPRPPGSRRQHPRPRRQLRRQLRQHGPAEGHHPPH